ncbi:MAG: hypothetical protein ACXW2Q_11405 [Thermoanaerobaculia bacterium]
MNELDFLLQGVLPLLGMLLGFGMVVFVVLIITRGRQRRLEMQTELQSKLIEKFGSATELAAFLQSPTGRQFVNGVQTGNRVMIQDRILAGYRRAIVLSFFGVAFIVLWMITGMEGLAWPGVLVLALGLGYLFATLATQKLTSESTGPIVPQPPPPEV